MGILVIHKASSILELILHFFDLSGLLFDHPLHLLSKLVLEMLFFVLKLLLHLGCPTLVFLKGLFAVQFSLIHSVMHTLDFCLLLRDGSFVAFYFLQELLYLLIESLNLTLEFHLSFPYLFFSLVSLIFKLLEHLGMIGLFPCNLGLELLIHRLDLAFMILLQTRYCCFMFIS